MTVRETLPGMRLLLSLALCAVASGCGCDRGQGLSGRHGELVVVVPQKNEPLLTRDAVLVLAPVVMGERGEQPVTVQNIGDAPVTLESLSLQGGSDALTLTAPAGLTLAAGESATLTAGFTPPQNGDATVPRVEHQALYFLTVSGTLPEAAQVSVTLRSEALAGDCLVPQRLDFGAVPLGHRITVPLRLSNTSVVDAQVSLGTVTGADAASLVLDDVAQKPHPAGTEVAFAFAFTPQAERRYEAAVEVRRGATCPVGVMALSGEGSDASLSWAPTQLDVGRIPLGEQATKAVTFFNASAADVTLNQLQIAGAVFTLPSSADVTVPARGTADIAVTCLPTALGRFTGELTLTAPFTPPRDLRVPVSCAGGGPRLRTQPDTSLSFGTVPWVSMTPPWWTARRLVVSNVGTPPLPGSTEHNLFLGRSGAPPFFSLVPGANTLPGEFTVLVPPGYDPLKGLEAVVGKNFIELDVRLSPQRTGPKQALLHLYSNDAVTPVVTMTLQANVASSGACTLEVTPRAVDFQALPPGTTGRQTVRFSNLARDGTVCHLTGIDIAPGSSPAFTLPGGAINELLVPQTAQRSVNIDARVPAGAPDGTTFSGYLRASTNDPRAPLILIPLAAQVARCLVATPSSVDFGAVKVGCRSSARAVSLYNTCGATIELQSITAPGAAFELLSQPAAPVSMPPGAAPLTVQLRARPPSLGPHSDVLRLTALEGTDLRTVDVALTVLGDAEGRQVDTFTVTPAQADILLTVDDSCSMADEQASLASNFQAFISAAQTSGIDYQLGVVTTDDFSSTGQGRLIGDPSNPRILTRATPNVAAKFAAKVQVGTVGSGLERPFSTSLKALTPPLTATTNQGLIRDGATLAVVVVSDAVEQSPNTSSYYLNRFLDLKGFGKSWLFSFNVIGPFGTPGNGCFYDSIADSGRYADVVRATSGVMKDICSTNWASDLSAISAAAFGARNTFHLTNPRESTQPMQVTSSGSALGGWVWDPVQNAVVFSSSAQPPSNSQFEVSYVQQCF